MKHIKTHLTQNELNTICQVCGEYGKEACTLCNIEQLRQNIVISVMKSEAHIQTTSVPR